MSGLLEGQRTEVPRDRWGRPLVVQPDGSERVAYTRVTTVADSLDNRRTLEAWLQRCVAVGLVDRPDLLALVASYNPTVDDREIDVHVRAASEAGKAHARANLGTALHRFAQRMDEGEPDVVAPPPWNADLDAYAKATVGFRWDVIEELVVLDELMIAGSPDRIGLVPDGRLVIADLKTGRGHEDTGELEFGWLKMAIQLALYSRARFIYDQRTDERRPMPEVDQDVALIIHLPAGEARCQLWELDIARGWELALLALDVRAARTAWKSLRRPWPQDTEKALEASLSAVKPPGLHLVPDPSQSGSEPPRALARAVLDARAPGELEGPDADPDALAVLKEHHDGLQPERRRWISDVRRTARDADVSPDRLSLTARASVKRFELARALIGLAERGMADDDIVRDLLLAVDPALAQPAIPLGAALAVLTVDEATTLARVVDALPV